MHRSQLSILIKSRYGEHPTTAPTATMAQVSVMDGERSNLFVGKLNKEVNDYLVSQVVLFFVYKVKKIYNESACGEVS